ncbi:MAG: hypothetical protein GY795_00820 [Desulfobacterales bacterium]|nr:hypothetical protein [Desulfobacterales bacterium]
MKKINSAIITCFICILFSSEIATGGFTPYSDIYVFVENSSTGIGIRNASVLAKDRDDYYKLEYGLTPYGEGYYGRYMGAGNYDIIVDNSYKITIYAPPDGWIAVIVYK